MLEETRGVKLSINNKSCSSGYNKRELYQLDYENTNPRFRKILQELEGLIGLDSVKDKIKEICALIEIQSRRRESGLTVETQTLHMIFKGKPLFIQG